MKVDLLRQPPPLIRRAPRCPFCRRKVRQHGLQYVCRRHKPAIGWGLNVGVDMGQWLTPEERYAAHVENLGVL